MAKNPLQSVCAWVVTIHAKTLYKGDIGTPVPIMAIKRFILEYAKERVGTGNQH